MSAGYAVCRLCGLDTRTRQGINDHVRDTHGLTPAGYRKIGDPEVHAASATEELIAGAVKRSRRESGIEVVEEMDPEGGYL